MFRSYITALAALAVLCLASPAAHADPAGDVVEAIKGCAAIPESTARHTCYDRVTAQLRPKAVSPATSAAPPPAPERFGSESLPAAQTEPAGSIAAVVTNVAYNKSGCFTVYLDNGQVWQQHAGDRDKARFPHSGKVRVTISHGLFGSYNLRIDGYLHIYKVKRIE